MDALQREQIDQEAFDESMQRLLSLPLEELRMKALDWQKFDRPCPPSNSYVYAVQSLGDVRGKKILDYGCGDGYLSIILAKRGGLLWGFDTSGQSVEVARKRALANGLSDRIQYRKMSVYQLEYEDGMFDLIIGLDILHHIEIGKAAGEVARILKKGGRAVFQEPFGDSSFLQTVRKFIPVKVAIHEGSQERQLTYGDVHCLAEPFSKMTCKEFQLLSRMDRVIKNTRVCRWLNKYDEWLLKTFPILRRYARTVVIELTKEGTI